MSQVPPQPPYGQQGYPPPPPPQQQHGGFPQQQPGYPPPQQGGYPPMAPGGYGQQPYGVPAGGRSNGAAIASLVLGLLGCVPLITGVFAVVLGIVGIRKTRDPQVGGKGMAIAGLILGVLSIGLWGVFGGAMYLAYAKSKPARAVARSFAADLSAGNVDAAQARCTADVSREELEATAAQMQGWGAFQDTTMPVFNYAVDNGVTTCDLAGVAQFANGTQQPFAVELVKVGDVFKVKEFVLGQASMTPPGPTPTTATSTDDASGEADVQAEPDMDAEAEPGADAKAETPVEDDAGTSAEPAQ